MSTAREQMLQRVRQAVMAGKRVGDSPASVPERGRIGYQGAGSDLVECFRSAFTAAGGQLHVAADGADATEAIWKLVHSLSIRRVLLGRSQVLDGLPILQRLRSAGVEIIDLDGGRQSPDSYPPQGANVGRSDIRFTAELGLSGVDYLIAETGSVVLASRSDQSRSLSLLPPIHIAVAERRQLLPDLFDLFAALGPHQENLPACVSIITGPSKTGDIELRLVTGVHGPGEIHVVLIGA